MVSRPSWSEDYDGMSGPLGKLQAEWYRRMQHRPSDYLPAHDADTTDVVGIAKDGMKMQLELLNISQHLHVLGVLYPATKQLFLDWTLLRNAPTGLGTQSTFVWRKSVDSSPAARFLVAWAIAHLSSESDPSPFVYSFVPARVTSNIHTIQRRLTTMRRVAQLLCPRERLYRQMRDIASQCPNKKQEDISWLIPALAELNGCPPCVVQLGFGNVTRTPNWQDFSAQLVGELPLLNLRQRQVANLYKPLPTSFLPQRLNPREITQLWL